MSRPLKGRQRRAGLAFPIPTTSAEASSPGIEPEGKTMSILKPGDRVRLPSGGPDMTIDRIIPVHCGSSIGYNVRCVWFVDGQYNSAIFSVDALEPVPDDQVPEPPTVRQPDPARRRSRGFD